MWFINTAALWNQCSFICPRCLQIISHINKFSQCEIHSLQPYILLFFITTIHPPILHYNHTSSYSSLQPYILLFFITTIHPPILHYNHTSSYSSLQPYILLFFITTIHPPIQHPGCAPVIYAQNKVLKKNNQLHQYSQSGYYCKPLI